MKPGIPWSVKGIEPEARVAAKKAAQQAGMTLGQWLNRTILTSPAPQSTPGGDGADWSPPPSQSDQELAALHEALTEMSQRFDEVEHNNQEIITHLDRAIKAAPGEARPALNSDLESKLLAQLEETKKEIFGRMEALESGLGRQLERETLKPLEGTLGKIVHHIETSEKRAIEGMRAMEQAIAHLAHRMDAAERQTAAPAGLKEPLAELENRIGRVEKDARENAEAIQERIYEISNALESPGPRKDAGTDDFPADYSAELRLEAIEATLNAIKNKIEIVDSGAKPPQEQTSDDAPASGAVQREQQARKAVEKELADEVIPPFGKRKKRRRTDHTAYDLPPVQPVPVPGDAPEASDAAAPPAGAEPPAQHRVEEVAKAPEARPAKAKKKARSRPPEMEKTARVKSPIADLVLDDEDEDGDEDHTVRGRIRRGVIGAILLSFIIMMAAAALVILGDGKFSVSDTLSKLDINSALSSLNVTMSEEDDPVADTQIPADASEPFPISITPALPAAAAPAGAPKTNPELDPLLSQQELPIEDLTRLSSEGNSWAQYRLGLRILDGRGAALDEPRGAELIAQAAGQDLAPAQYRLGALYESGTGLEQDFSQARLWYGKAARAGNRKAMYNLGVIYAEAHGVERDYAQALDWFSKAARLGLTDSQFNFATLLYRGFGTAPDPVQAYKWFAIAASKGDAGAAEMKTALEAELDASSLASAKALIAIWQPKPMDSLVNIEF